MEQKCIECKLEMTFVSAVLQLQAGTATTRKGKMANNRWKHTLDPYVLQFQKCATGKKIYCASLKWLLCQSECQMMGIIDRLFLLWVKCHCKTQQEYFKYIIYWVAWFEWAHVDAKELQKQRFSPWLFLSGFILTNSLVMIDYFAWHMIHPSVWVYHAVNHSWNMEEYVWTVSVNHSYPSSRSQLCNTKKKGFLQ